MAAYPNVLKYLQNVLYSLSNNCLTSQDPNFIFADAEAIPWTDSEMANSVAVKTLCGASGRKLVWDRK